MLAQVVSICDFVLCGKCKEVYHALHTVVEKAEVVDEVIVQNHGVIKEVDVLESVIFGFKETLNAISTKSTSCVDDLEARIDSKESTVDSYVLHESLECLIATID